MEWISADTIHKLETSRETERKTVLNNSRTRAAIAKAQEENTAADREVKRSIKRDKRGYIDDLARQAEAATRQGNLRDLYLVTKQLAGKFQQTDKPVKDKNGNPLTTTKEQLKGRAEHFRELLNRPTPDSPPDILSTETELPISRDQENHHDYEKWEGCRAGRDTGRSHQSRHRDSCQHTIQPLQQDLGEGGGTGPVERRNHHQAAKKRDLRDCSNYRGIMLLSTPGKVLNRVLLERMKEAVDPKLRDQKAGFQQNKSCADQIARLPGVELLPLHQLHRL